MTSSTHERMGWFLDHFFRLLAGAMWAVVVIAVIDWMVNASAITGVVSASICAMFATLFAALDYR